MYRRSLMSFVAVVVACASVALADTLVLKDGRRVNGKVEEGDGVYIVEHEGKRTSIPDTEVAEWIAGQTEAEPFTTPLGELKFEAPTEEPTDTTTEPTDAATAPVDATPGGVNASVENHNPASHVGRQVELRNERAVAFPVAPDLVVTSARVVVDAINPQLTDRGGDAVPFELVRADDKLGLALLRVKGPPMKALRLADSFDAAKINSGGEMRTCGYFGMNLFEVTLEFADCKAERPSAKAPWTIEATKHPATPGGPVLFGNQVIGVQLAERNSAIHRVPAVTLEQLRQFLGKDYAKPPGETDPAQSAMQLNAQHERPQE
ncbi:MAG TPA: trypsin-like peptidase domain-containing protein [Tepidisphaeraceae bacterium]|jgi:hypothetical protein|nr:trypsin-like peptidase domain-containing protein [Tepidisphaeraceae bacterium]